MKFVNVTSDGQYYLNGDLDGTNAVETTRDVGSVVISGTYTTVTMGYEGQDGNFQPYSDGLLTAPESDASLHHGYGAMLMVDVVGVAGSVVIGYAG